MALVPAGNDRRLIVYTSSFSTGRGITSLSYNICPIPAGGVLQESGSLRRSLSLYTSSFSAGDENRELHPHLLTSSLTNEAFLFLVEFFKHEPTMRKIERKLRKIADEVKEKFGQADTARTTGAVVGGAGLTALGLGYVAGLLTGGIGTIVAATAAAAGVGTVGVIRLVKRDIAKDQTEIVEELGNDLIQIVNTLMETLKKIKTTCQKQKTGPVNLFLREVKELESEVEELEKEVEELEREVEVLKREVEELESEVGELERKREELERKREELERKKNELERKRKELERKRGEEKLKRKKEEFERRREVEERKRKELERMRDVKKLERKVRELEEALTDLERVPDEDVIEEIHSFLTMEHMQLFLQNTFRGSPTAEQDKELPESIIQLAKQSRKVTDKFREISLKLEN